MILTGYFGVEGEKDALAITCCINIILTNSSHVGVDNAESGLVNVLIDVFDFLLNCLFVIYRVHFTEIEKGVSKNE